MSIAASLLPLNPFLRPPQSVVGGESADARGGFSGSNSRRGADLKAGGPGVRGAIATKRSFSDGLLRATVRPEPGVSALSRLKELDLDLNLKPILYSRQGGAVFSPVGLGLFLDLMA